MTARRLSLTEFRTERGVLLSAGERDAIRRLHPGLQVEPSLGFEDRYDLTPDERVGVISLPSLIIEIRPKVPMSSVLFLVSYACDSVTWFKEEPEFSKQIGLPEVLALMLARLVSQATRRGLLNGYQSEDEALRAPRGRILFDEHLRRRLGIAPPIEVRHDVFTSDITENRLLLAALAVMGRLPHRSAVVRRALLRGERPFGGVKRVQFSPAFVPDVQITRLNRHYESALKLASLLLRSASLDVGMGNARGVAFLINMNLVFERFVRVALREALDATPASFPERAPERHLDDRGVVPIKPDLCLLDEDRFLWVGDAKYKRLLAGGYQNPDLYQLLAYAVALGLPGGTLIYAADKGVTEADHTVLNAGKSLHVVALNLFVPPKKILERVAEIAHRVRRSSNIPRHTAANPSEASQQAPIRNG